jgi:hypothetical protein
LLTIFRMPTPVKITGRTSSITNAFVNGIIPCIMPTEKEIREVLTILGMAESVKCAYCGDKYTEWDHFRPLIQNKRPTGYISEIHNLVPACGKCNQSKGNSYWKEWILSDAKLSPKTRKIESQSVLIKRLEDYEKWSKPTNIDFEEIVGPDVWEEHWENCEKLHKMMFESQKLSDKIRFTIAQRVRSSKSDELSHISQNISRSIDSQISITSGKTNNEDTGKARNRIPKWALKSEQNNHKIVRAYFQVENELGNVSLDVLEKRCSDVVKYPSTYLRDFRGNFNQMKIDSPKSHGKVFEVYNGKVVIWDYVKETLKEYKKYFCR